LSWTDKMMSDERWMMNNKTAFPYLTHHSSFLVPRSSILSHHSSLITYRSTAMARTLVINSEIQIPANEITMSFARSAGPGGQNVNKVNTKAMLRWNVT